MITDSATPTMLMPLAEWLDLLDGLQERGYCPCPEAGSNGEDYFDYDRIRVGITDEVHVWVFNNATLQRTVVWDVTFNPETPAEIILATLDTITTISQ